MHYISLYTQVFKKGLTNHTLVTTGLFFITDVCWREEERIVNFDVIKLIVKTWSNQQASACLMCTDLLEPVGLQNNDTTDIINI